MTLYGQEYSGELKQAFNNGHTSYPSKRILYPNSPGPLEDAWLAGWNNAEYHNKLDITGAGVDTFLWNYKSGD